MAHTFEVSEQTYYRWKRQYGNMAPDDSRRLRENERLKKVVAELILDKAVLREALAKR